MDAPLVKKIFLDSGYAGEPFAVWAKTTTGIEVEVVRRPDEGITVVDGIAQLPTNTPTEEQFRLAVEMARQGGKGFKVVRKRWVVERTFAWLLTFRRLRVCVCSLDRHPALIFSGHPRSLGTGHRSPSHELGSF